MEVSCKQIDAHDLGKVCVCVCVPSRSVVSDSLWSRGP